jgi:glycerophosphoryl diester phosphodiesterase
MRRSVCSLVISFVALLTACVAAGEPEPRVVGHRGLMPFAPENTLAGYRACLALRVGFEFDVRRSKDGELICLHDATVDRTTDGRGRLDAMTRIEVARLDAGSWYAPAFRGERVPTIAQILALVASDAQPNTLIAVDMKDTGQGIEEAVVELAKRNRVLDRLLFIGATITSPEIRSRLHAADPNAATARLANMPDELPPILEDEHADWAYLRYLPSPDEVARIRAAGKKIFIAGPLTAGKETAHWAKARELGIDGILTDYPLELQQTLRHPKQ